ncbi:hypothetical protein VTI28DRAFT_6532 [Corynascus sepedonium]
MSRTEKNKGTTARWRKDTRRTFQLLLRRRPVRPMRTRPAQTIKWGTACAQCAAAKAKCSGRPTDPGKCDRCERLLKQCTDQVHKPRKKRQSRQSQTTEFDSLVSTPENPSSPMAGISVQGSPSGDIQPAASQNPPHFTRARSTSSQQNVEGGFAATTAVYHPDPHILSPESLDEANADIVMEGRDVVDQELLSIYRTELMPQHPFVIVPQHMSATVLKAHFPFLMMTIRVIASFESLSTMHARMRIVSLRLTDKMFRQYERSLDLLMGIVVILGWHHYHCSKHSQLNSLLCLAESLISDLGLNRSPPIEDGEKRERITAEEKRLLLGVWYLRSSAAMHLQQLTSMPFTPFMRQSLVELQEGKKHSLDEALVQCVKIQYLAERVAVLKSPQLRNIASKDNKAVLDMGEQNNETQELEDNVTIATQLRTVSTDGPDFDKFWDALGESYGTELTKQHAIAIHPNPSTVEKAQKRDEDNFGGTTMVTESLGRQFISDASFMAKEPGITGMYPSYTFIPPSKVGSATLGHPEYGDASSLLHLPTTTPARGSSHLSAAQVNQWTAAQEWDVNSTSWPHPNPASTTMNHGNPEQQMWDPSSRRGAPYGWGDKAI